VKPEQRAPSVFHVKQDQRAPNVCDYEGSDYRQRFWTRERRYEDLAERQGLRRLLPPEGEAVADLGAGFGRLIELYQGYRRIFLVDYSRTLLQQARQEHLGDDRFTYIASDIRRLPLASDAFDTVLTVRVLHHLRDVPDAIAEAARVLVAGGHYLLEFANKRHLKAIVRYLLHRQGWNPFDKQPVEFAELNFDFHPAYIGHHLVEAGLRPERRLALSLFRLQLLKQGLGPRRLAGLETLAQPLASLYPLSPSVLLCSRADKPQRPRPGYFLACPYCHARIEMERQRAVCRACRLHWPEHNGIYDFKGPGQELY